MTDFAKKLYEDFVSGQVYFFVSDEDRIGEVQAWLDSFVDETHGPVVCAARKYKGFSVMLVSSRNAHPDWNGSLIRDGFERMLILPWAYKDAMLDALQNADVETILTGFVSRESFINILGMRVNLSDIICAIQDAMVQGGCRTDDSDTFVADYLNDCYGDVFRNLFVDDNGFLNASTEAGLVNDGYYRQSVVYPIAYLAIKLKEEGSCEFCRFCTDADFSGIFEEGLNC